MLPSLQEDESVMESGRVAQRPTGGSVDSSAGPSSTNTSTSTSPSSSISDACMTIEHAKETGFSSIIPQLKNEEPEICDSFASLHAPFSESEIPKQAIHAANSHPPAREASPKIEKQEKREITGSIPLSRLFDFDKEDQKSDLIVKNESERQYQRKLRDEFDAVFEGMNDQTGDHERNGSHTMNKSSSFTNGRSHIYDSDEEEIRIDDDDDDDDNSSLRRNKQSLPPPPPPPPIGPPTIKHLPSALDDAQSTYQQIEHNIYRGANTGNSPVDDCLPCQCKYNPHRDPRWKACGPDCINRNLLVECIEDDCPCGSYCLNRRFQTKQNAHVDVVKTEKKGYGLRAMEGLAPGTFVMEYIGEVLPHSSFVKRTREYSQAGVEHFYFMSLQSDEVIDATKRGCLARFINHSCSPNCHLEKWVVGSKLRIGIFTIKRVAEGEELTFDYQFERYGAEAQKCYCGELNCTGFIGGNKRSSATRLDNYNLDEVEDEDEIDLENQMSLRLPKKDKGNDGDYEDEYEQRRITRGIEDPLLVEKLARIMFMKPKVQKSKRLLAKLVATTERACLRRFLVLHGLVILKAWLKHYKDEPDIIMGIMLVLPNIPLLSRNAIEDSQIEEAVQEVADGPECPSKGLAEEVLTQWKVLKSSYRIPKAKKPAVPAVTDTISTPIDDPPSFMSPAESVGSGSAEGLGKRQYEDEDRASTPAGMEKRGKFEGQPGQTPDDIDVSTIPPDSSRYHGYHYDSPDYGPRPESHRDHYNRMGDGYGRDVRDGGYGRVDFGRHESHSREGSYSRSGDPGYGRSDSYGRIDPYGMSKAGYERGRYEHYRGDRDRERDRYYDYYRERDYDRDYRSHRDPRDLRDMRDPREIRDDRDRDYRDPRDYREQRDLFSHPPPSPRPRDRDISPSATRRERSPSASTQLGSWPGDKSRSSSPAKGRINQSSESSLLQNDGSKAPNTGAQDAETPDRNTPTSSIGNLPALLAEEAIVSSPSILSADKTISSPAQIAPTPLRNYTLANDQQESNSSASAAESAVVASATPSNTAPSASHHGGDYPYRNSSGHGDYPHSRYGGHSGGAYHHSQYYRHSSSYHYKSHYPYRGAPSRAYSSPSNYPPPAVELPPNWAKATDSEGRVYYYNEISRATQWDPPRIEPPAPAAAAPVLEPIPQAPAAHYPQSHPYHHQSHQQQQQPLVARIPTPEPPKPVNIDGFTQEQLQEVIGRAYDKQKQKNLANGIGSAGASVHDVDSPTTRGGNMHSPSMARLGKPLKSMNEKDLKAAISSYVVKNMAKYKTKLETSEAFKKHARRITHLIADKEMRSKTFKAGELTEITVAMKNKIRRFIKDYMAKLIKKQLKEERSSSSSTAALVNGTRNSISHVIVLGADGAPVPPMGSVLSSKELTAVGLSSSVLASASLAAAGGLKRNDSLTFATSQLLKNGGSEKKLIGYGDVDVDDDDDVKYGEGEDGDEDEGDLDGDDDDDDAGVAAVPSSSVELPL
ncbi:histone methyltransferase set2 [Mortierella sp. AM989]|nr:histone methyltransferase set2 [Mortierella sp. AM989]